MDLINASAEVCSWKFDGTVYTFPPNEVVTVKDDAGYHLANKLLDRGVVIVSYGDNPTEIKLSALRAVVAYHQRQVKAHEDQRKVAIDQRNPVPAEPDSYPIAKVALEIYGPALEKAETKKKEETDDELRSRMTDALDSDMETVELEDMDQDQMRAMVRSFGEEPDMRHGPKKLRERIRELQANA